MTDDKNIEILIKNWFELNKLNINKPHFWNRNKTAKIIKEYLLALGRWNIKPRGNPEKGWAKLKEKEAQKDLEKRFDF
jgi:hypothetical protein